LQGFPEEIRAIFIATRQAYGIDFPNGMEALRRLLNCAMPHVFVSTRDLAAMVEGSKRTQDEFAERRESSEVRTRYPRPELGSAYAAPRNEVEQRIASIWGDILGVDPVGIDDNFFELGGNSLTGLELFARIRKTLKLDKLPAHVLYEAPTVELQAAYIASSQHPVVLEEEHLDQDDEDQRRAQLSYFVDLDETGDL
jgi:hypothetical protein